MAALRDLSRDIGFVAARVLDLALPAVCAGCGVEGRALCAECAPALDVRANAPPGVPIGLPGEVPMPLAQVEWCAGFSGVTRRALHHLKYAGEQRLAEPLGRAVARRWAAAGVGGDLIIPVPASSDRVRDRGYDHAVLLARVVGRELGMPVREDLLERARTTVAQFDLDRIARAGNMAGAFRLRRGARMPVRAGGSGAHAGPWIVLVDDVLTTGSTLAECATVLLAAGALAVSAVTVARER